MELMEWVNASGEVFLSHTKLDGRVSLRVAIGNLATVESDLERCRQLLEEGLACLAAR
jgi:aromatic-L-amino-acid decarboxylase